MSNQIGRLTIGRKEGQSFVVGDNTLVTVRSFNMRVQKATVEVTCADSRSVEEFEARHDQTIHLLPDVDMILRFDGQHGRQIKITLVAPKSVSIMRSELLNEQQKHAVGA